MFIEKKEKFDKASFKIRLQNTMLLFQIEFHNPFS